MRKMLTLALILVAVFIFSAPNVLAQEPCTADFNCDQNVDATDVDTFLSQFGRNPFNDPCPDCYDSPCPCSTQGCDPPAPVEKSGQTTSYATGDDGDLETGVEWPNPRFTDNGDGTVTDNLTGLIWLKNANCFGLRTWNNALSDSNGLENGECGLTDGSGPGDWRLPNKKELISITHDECSRPAVPNTTGTGCWSAGDPFTNVSNNYHWSSTTGAFNTDVAWVVDVFIGFVDGNLKTYSNYVWPVRGGE
jgi:hypothetical protein